jgi:hypothetical protein
MGGLITLAEAVAGETVNMPSKWYFGAGTLAVFLILLWIVTRINIDR